MGCLGAFRVTRIPLYNVIIMLHCNSEIINIGTQVDARA